MATLIKSCWQTEPSTRPDIKIILSILENLDFWILLAIIIILQIQAHNNNLTLEIIIMSLYL